MSGLEHQAKYFKQNYTPFSLRKSKIIPKIYRALSYAWFSTAGNPYNSGPMDQEIYLLLLSSN